MTSILIIFNGIKFPYYLMEYSIARAKADGASLNAIFLQGKQDRSPGYGFPSDLGQTEILTDAEDAVKDDERIMRHTIKLARDMAATENVPFTSELKTDSSLDEILQIIKPFDIVFLDANYDDETPSMFTNDRFTSKELIERASGSVQLISEDSGGNN